MSGFNADQRGKRAPLSVVALLAVSALGLTGSASAKRLDDPLRFFEGRTEMISTVKLVAKKPYRSRTLGRGVIRADGTLHLVQQVHDEGQRAYNRHWLMRQIAPRRFAGTMSEAKGGVVVEEIDGQYRFRFKMKGSLSIEQWLTPVASGTAARSRIIIRKLGMRVGHSEGTIRRL